LAYIFVADSIGPILHRFRDLTAFMCSWPTPIPP